MPGAKRRAALQGAYAPAARLTSYRITETERLSNSWRKPELVSSFKPFSVINFYIDIK